MAGANSAPPANSAAWSIFAITPGRPKRPPRRAKRPPSPEAGRYYAALAFMPGNRVLPPAIAVPFQGTYPSRAGLSHRRAEVRATIYKTAQGAEAAEANPAKDCRAFLDPR